ncbi:hypothetical protein SCUCBS95973_002130 [Sporothrix curviconia]|uniref:mRNA splicing factor RNA helicase n=1 Tax=Sporothrix curviconia TaxID=1260050 RepID=A0ABP0B4C1_9PEZI
MDSLHSGAPDAVDDAPLPALVFGRSSKKRKSYRQRGTDPTEPTADEPVATAPGSPSKAEKDEAVASATRRPGPTAEDGDNERKETIDDCHGRRKDDDGGGDDDDCKAEKIEKIEKNGGTDSEDEGVSVAELRRRRKARKPISGVTFRGEDGKPSASSATNARLDHALDSMELDLANDSMPMGVQFVKQTGMIGQLVNKHMEEYVDAQLAKRHLAEATQAHGGPSTGPGPAAGGSGAGVSGPGGPSSTEAREQLAMKGKLHEIDLGAEARARNVAMTERATQRLRGAGDNTDDSPDNKQLQPPPRLGRDGKPLARKRRDSDDIKRDQLVEQFLHENRMDVDVYTTGRDTTGLSSGTAATATATTEGRPTDDRIAEQFRREFMEAAAQRMRRKRKPLGPPTKPKPRNEEEILRGPKLGGSRNVRSVMRDKLLQKQEEERHNMPKYEQQLQEQKRRMLRRR